MIKVLIIDDEEIIRQGLKLTVDWESLGCEVAGEAEDGYSGLKLLASVKPDIIFTDIRMPGLDGLEMISKARAMKFDSKVIILTGYRDFEYAQEAIRQGAFRFLLKPVKTADLYQCINEAVSEIKKEKSREEIYSNLEKRVKEFYGLEQAQSPDPQQHEDDGCNQKYLVGKALEFMKANYASELDLKTVSNEIYVSTWYLSKLLKKETGDNFINILNEIRVENAKKLLGNPKLKIYEISSEVGFTDVPYFTKIFKRVAGCTPMEYRNSLK